MNNKRACVHHWEIDRATDLKSNGKCKLCGETREFDNFVTLKRLCHRRGDRAATVPREPDMVPGGHFYGLRLSAEEPQ